MNSRNKAVTEALEMMADPEFADLAQFRPSLIRYLEDHIETGHFLRRILENDLMGALGHMHPLVTAKQLRALATLINSSFPARSWGSPEAVELWIRQRDWSRAGLEGEA